MKFCTACNTEQPKSNFFKNSQSPDGHQRRCKQCAKNYFQNDGVMKKYVARNTEYVNRKRSQLAALKATLSCKSCGEPSSSCLDFHHIKPHTKERCVSEMVRSHSWEMILREVKKCVCVCRNCHAKIHAGEMSLPI